MHQVTHDGLINVRKVVVCLHTAGPVNRCQRQQLRDVMMNDDAKHGAIAETGGEVAHAHSVVLPKQLAPLQTQIKTTVFVLAHHKLCRCSKAKQRSQAHNLARDGFCGQNTFDLSAHENGPQQLQRDLAVPSRNVFGHFLGITKNNADALKSFQHNLQVVQLLDGSNCSS